MPLKLKTLWQEKAVQVLLVMAAAWLTVRIPQWAGLFTLEEPWKTIVNDLVTAILGGLRALQLFFNDPSVSAKALPMSMKMQLPSEDQEKLRRIESKKSA